MFETKLLQIYMKHSLISSFLAVATMLCACSKPITQDKDIMLADGWAIQASSKVAEDGDVLSVSGADCNDWYKASVPSTVMGALTTENGL